VITIPQFRNSQDILSRLQSKKNEAKDLSDKVTILSGIDKQVLDDRVKILDNALPPQKDVVLYLTSVDGLSRELNLSFGGISLAPGNLTSNQDSTVKNAKQSADKLGLQSLDTDIKISGTQENIYSFLRLIEQSAPLMQIKDAKVSHTEGTAYNLTLRLGMLWAESTPSTVKGQISLFDEKEEKYFQDLSQYRRFETTSEVIGDTATLGKSDLFASPALSQ
jgi:hypothetical protein